MNSSIATSASTNRNPFAGKNDFYPSKMFSLSEHYVPRDIKEIFRFCEYLVISDPAVSGAIHKMAEAPITDILYDFNDERARDRFKHLLEGKMRIREKLLEAIFDLMVYSNAFLSFEVPITRYLISPNLHQDIRKDAESVNSRGMESSIFDKKYEEALGRGHLNKRYRADALEWEITGDGQFKGRCPETGSPVTFIRQDRYYPSAENVSLKRWDPNRINIHHNEVTGKNKYYYTLSYESRNLIKTGDRDHYIEDPWEYILAARENKNVRIRNEQLYHMSNVKISGSFNGWGLPRLFSAFKHIFYYMTILRANEAIAIGRINDLTILFPQTSSSLMDPASAIPGSSFRANMLAMLRAHQRDKNFVGISPIPIGTTSVFGQGRMQLVSAELEPVVRMICVAIGLPYDMLFGGGAYTGQAVGQRVFTSQTGLTKEKFDELLAFVVEKVSGALGQDRYPSSMKVTLKDAEGPDDIQKKQLRMQMSMSNKASLTTTMEDLGMDPSKEFELMEEEAKKMNRPTVIQARGQAIAQMEAQEIMQRGQGGGEGGMEQGGGPGMGQGGMEQGGDPGTEQGGVGQEGGAPGGFQGSEMQEAGPGQQAPQEDLMPSPEGTQPVDPSMMPSDQVLQQARTLHDYIQSNPDLSEEMAQYASVHYPAAFKVMQGMQSQDNGTDGDMPDIPTMDDPSYQFDEAQKKPGTISVSGAPSSQLPGNSM